MRYYIPSAEGRCDKCEGPLEITDFKSCDFTGLCDYCFDYESWLVDFQWREKMAEFWLDDAADLDNDGDALAVWTLQRLTLLQDDPAVLPEHRAHAAAWLADFCDLSNEYDKLAFDFFTQEVL